MKKHTIHSINYTMTLTTFAAALWALATACSQTGKAADDSTTTAFKYREVYLPEGKGDSARRLNLNTLDYDWGIWGHNLAKVLPEDHSKNVYAKVNGSSSKKQFCFSSNHLYEYIEEFIDTKYDDDNNARFAILPNDNDIVCLCEKCVVAGNTYGNASPAVNKLVRKLAQRFPNQKFYTSDYRTTSAVPTDTMPHNTGVLISAMEYPLNTVGGNEEQRFMDRIKRWTPVVPRVVVWDYINNFDDYFTPYPVFNVMQHRFQNYRDNGVTGLFLNGSGSDVSAMSDIKTEVLAEMTANPDVDWQTVLREKATELYPISGSAIANFMLAQEEMVAKSGVTLPMYDGVETALKTYLPEKEFVEFHDRLLKLRPSVDGEERKALDKLLAQLALTRLEIKRINSDFKDAEPLIDDLRYLLSQEVEGYNETGWSIENYINDYNYLLKYVKDTGKKNKLKGDKLIPLTALDQQYTDISILTDGKLGIPSNYHSGLLINSPKDYTQIAVPYKPGAKKVRVWFAYNPPYRIFLPESVTLMVNGKKEGTMVPAYPQDDSGHSWVEFDVSTAPQGTYTLTFHKDPEKHSMAIEEIEVI